jgi:hypothetical protein
VPFRELVSVAETGSRAQNIGFFRIGPKPDFRKSGFTGPACGLGGRESAAGLAGGDLVVSPSRWAVPASCRGPDIHLPARV